MLQFLPPDLSGRRSLLSVRIQIMLKSLDRLRKLCCYKSALIPETGLQRTNMKHLEYSKSKHGLEWARKRK